MLIKNIPRATNALHQENITPIFSNDLYNQTSYGTTNLHKLDKLMHYQKLLDRMLSTPMAELPPITSN
jgi:hypothetical protein